MSYKFDLFKYSLLGFSIIFLVLVLFNIISPNEAFAMEPNTDDVIRSFNPDSYIRHELDGKSITKPKCLYQGRSRFAVDYYGHKEYQGRDAYGYYHQPQNLYKATQVEPLSSTKTVYELDAQGKIVGSFLVSGEQSKVYELNADSYEGTISTDVDSVTWARRTHNYMEIIRDYNMYVDNIPKNGILTKISLCVKTTNDNILFLYLKFNEIGKRKILWTIWERNRGKYDSYKQFKRSWDSKSGILSNIKKDIRDDIRAEVEDLLGIRKIKKDLKKSIRTEVEKLLRDTRPFER